MPDLVCIDANTCVWGIKKKPSPGQEHMVPKTEAFFKSLEQQKTRILIPAPVITEILVPVAPSDRAALMGIISKNFMVAPLDTMAAIRAGELWHENKDRWEEIYETEGEDAIRNRFKYDIVIAGIAISRNVDCLYTNDKGLRNLCKPYIYVSEIPDSIVQGGLFTSI